MNDAYYNMDQDTRAAIEDNRIYQEEREYIRREELVKRFINGWDKYNKEPLFRNIIDAAAKGADVWDIVDKLIEMNSTLSDRCKKLMTCGSFPVDFQL